MNQQDQSILVQPAAINPIEEITDYDRLLSQYSVSFFCLMDIQRAGNSNYHDIISPLFATREQAQKYKGEKKIQFPNCYISKHEVYFTSELEGNRKELLSKIVCTEDIQ